MNRKNLQHFGVCLIAGLWLALALALWFGPRKEMSESERPRPLRLPPSR